MIEVSLCDVRSLSIGERAEALGEKPNQEGPLTARDGAPQIGIRPEYISVTSTGLTATVTKVADVGRHFGIDAIVGNLA